MSRESFMVGMMRTLGAWRLESGPARYFAIELSSRHRWYVPPLRTTSVLLAWGLGLLIAWDLAETAILSGEAENLRAGLERVREQDRQLMAEAAQEGIDLSEPALQRLPAEVALANQLIAKRSFSWTRFLSDLEQAIPARLAIGSVRLDASSAIIRITGTAISLEDVTALTVSLQDHPTFKDPVLGQHRHSPGGLVEFDLTLRYRPQGT